MLKRIIAVRDRTAFVVLATALLATSLLVVAPAGAQRAPGDPSENLPRLRDADAEALGRVLSADKARAQASARGAGAVAEAAMRELSELTRQANTPDPRGAVRARTRYFVVPPTARYDSACSHEVSRLTLAPRAVYAIGRPADEIAGAIRKRDPATLSSQEIMDLMTAQATSSAGVAFEEAMRFYRARGFVVEGTVSSSVVFTRGERSSDPLMAVLYTTNAGAGAGAASCARLGNTALVVLQLRDANTLIGGALDALPEVSAIQSADRAHTAALRAAGLSETRYNTLVTAALMAAVDAEQPEVLETMTSAAASMGDADHLDDRRRDQLHFAVRRDNVLWYRRHQKLIAPLLAQWRLQSPDWD